MKEGKFVVTEDRGGRMVDATQQAIVDAEARLAEIEARLRERSLGG